MTRVLQTVVYLPAVSRCLLCGALVHPDADGNGLHEAWHARLDKVLGAAEAPGTPATDPKEGRQG